MQVQRVGRAQRDQFVTRRSFADRAQQTARFPPAINPAEFVPGCGKTLAFEQATEDDAVTPQQHARKFFDCGTAMSGICAIGFELRFFSDQGPTSGELDAREVRFAATLPFVASKRWPFV